MPKATIGTTDQATDLKAGPQRLEAYEQIDIALVETFYEVVKGIGDIGDLPSFPFGHPAAHVDRDAFGERAGRCCDDRRILEYAYPDRNAVLRGPRQGTRRQPEQPGL